MFPANSHYILFNFWMHYFLLNNLMWLFLNRFIFNIVDGRFNNCMLILKWFKEFCTFIHFKWFDCCFLFRLVRQIFCRSYIFWFRFFYRTFFRWRGLAYFSRRARCKEWSYIITISFCNYNWGCFRCHKFYIWPITTLKFWEYQL